MKKANSLKDEHAKLKGLSSVLEYACQIPIEKKQSGWLFFN